MVHFFQSLLFKMSLIIYVVREKLCHDVFVGGPTMQTGAGSTDYVDCFLMKKTEILQKSQGI